MKINYLDLSQNNRQKNAGCGQNVQNKAFTNSKGYSITSYNTLSSVNAVNNLSFKGDNIYDVVHFIPEGILGKAGGVGTVMEDVYSKLSEYIPEDKDGNPQDKRTRNIFFAPYYDGDKSDVDENGRLKPKIKLVDNIPCYIVGNKKFPLKKVLSGKLKEYDNNVLGCFKDAPYTVYDASDSVPVGLKGKNPNDCTSRLFIVSVPKTLIMSKAYTTEDITGYAAYIGGGVFENCSQFAMAVVDALPKMQKLFEEDTTVEGKVEKRNEKELKSRFNMPNFDPRNFLVHDIHCSAAHYYITQAAIQGEELYRRVNLSQYFHNVGTAYQCKGIDAIDFVKCMMPPETFNKILNSKEFRKLAYNNETRTRPLSGIEIENFFKKFVPNLLDDKNNINPTMIPLTYAVKGEGYVRAAAVSGEYAKEIANIAEMTDGLQRLFYRAYENGSLIGIVNGSKLPTKDMIVDDMYKELFVKEKGALKNIINSEIKDGLQGLNKEETKTLLLRYLQDTKIENLFLEENKAGFSETQIKELAMKMLDVQNSGLDCEKKLYLKNLKKTNDEVADAIKNIRNGSSSKEKQEAKDLLINKYGLSEDIIQKYTNIPSNPNMDNFAEILIREFQETQKYANAKKIIAQVIEKNGAVETFEPLLDDENVKKIFTDKFSDNLYENLSKISSNMEDGELKTKLNGILTSEKIKEAQKYLDNENNWIARYKGKVVDTIADENEFAGKIDSLFAVTKDKNTGRFSINIAKGDKIGNFGFDTRAIAEEFIKNTKLEDKLTIFEENGKFYPIYNLGARFIPQTFETEQGAKDFLETIKKDLFVVKEKEGTFKIVYKQRILPLKGFDVNPFKINDETLEEIGSIKKSNMQNMVERITKATLDNAAFEVPELIEINAEDKTIKPKGKSAFSASSLLSGENGRDVKVNSNFTENTIKWSKEHPERIRFLTSWGRVDVQKAYDVVLMAIKKFTDNETKMRNESWAKLKTLLKSEKDFISQMEEIDKKLTESSIGADEKRNIQNEFLEKVNVFAHKNDLKNVSEIIDKMLITPLFVISAGLNDNEESGLVKQLYSKILEIPELKGRFAFLDGWGPASSLTSSADFTILPSNFAPCELTPLEGQVRGAITITSNTGGLKQTTISEYEPLNNYQKSVLEEVEKMSPQEIKTLDSAIAKHKEKNPFMSGFKTKHGYYTIKNDIYEFLKEADGVPKPTDDEKKNIFNLYRKAYAADALVDTNQALRNEGINDEYLINDKKYSDLMRIYRTAVMSDEVSNQIEEAIYADADKIKKMRKNCMCKYSDWDNNTCVNDGKSAMQLMAKHFFQNFDPKQKAIKAPLDIQFVDMAEINSLEQEKHSFLSFKGSVNFTTAIAAGAALAGATAVLTTANNINRREKEIELVKKQLTQSQYPEYKPATIIPKAEEIVHFNTNYCSIDDFKKSTNVI